MTPTLMTTKLDSPSGLVIVDKPADWTSHDVVGKLRRIFGTRKVGHSGTLDPMATGVLVCGVGQGTRLMGYVSDAGKAYDATIRLGLMTSTDDAEGDVSLTTPVELTTELETAARANLSAMVGEIHQRPSSVSAIKVDGERAYEKMRRGESVELPARQVTIEELTVHSVQANEHMGMPVVDIDVSVACSSGTYIRAIARDLGEELGVGGILTSLRRARVGEFTLDDSLSIEQLEQEPTIMSMEHALPALFHCITLDQDNARKFGNGGKVSPEVVAESVRATAASGTLLGVLDADGRALGVAEYSERAIAPKIVWPN